MVQREAELKKISEYKAQSCLSIEVSASVDSYFNL